MDELCIGCSGSVYSALFICKGAMLAGSSRGYTPPQFSLGLKVPARRELQIFKMNCKGGEVLPKSAHRTPGKMADLGNLGIEGKTLFGCRTFLLQLYTSSMSEMLSLFGVYTTTGIRELEACFRSYCDSAR